MSAEADALLMRVHDRLSDPARWHGESDTRLGDISVGGALNAADEQVEVDDPSAVRWCLIGALKLESGVLKEWPMTGPADEAYERVIAAAGWPPSQCYNDRDGYEVVIAAVQKAIEVG